MKKTLLTSSIVGCLLAPQLMADAHPDAEVYLGAAQYFWDSERNLDNSTSLEGGIEIPADEALSFEAWISDFDADLDSGTGELDGRKYSLGGLYHLSEGDLRPFVSLGGSHQEFEASGGSDADESLVYLGLGAKKYFDNNLILRGEVLAMNSLDNELTDLGARIAIGYAFGRQAHAAPVSEMPAKPIVKAEPVKPAEPALLPVEPEPKPAPAPVKLDSDKDGVYDDMDTCPDTGREFKVDANGCAITLMETVSINVAVTFKTNSAEVSGSDADIKKLAEFLNRFKETRATVEGHTDDRGRAAYNKSLSQKRADSVKTILIEQYGIAADRVSAVGFGEETPIASNDTPEGRMANRRVVAKVSADYERTLTK